MGTIQIFIFVPTIKILYTYRSHTTAHHHRNKL